MKRSPLLVICVCIWMLLSLTTVEAGYWQRTGGPRILTNADTASQMNLKVAESAATTKTLMGQEAAVIHWSWNIPPQSFAPGDIIQVNLRYQIAAMVGVHWEGSGSLNAALEMPNVPLGHGTSATLQLARLDIWPRGTRPGMSNSVTNTTVKAPPQSGDRVIRISTGGAYVGPGFGVEYYYKWMEGNTAPQTPKTPTVSQGKEQLLYYNSNDNAVYNSAKSPWMRLELPARITYLMTYHWNDGQGAPGGTIALVSEAGATYGPWQATARNGVYWEVFPQIVLPAGRYRIVDSDPETWAQNAATKGTGHTIIKGVLQ